MFQRYGKLGAAMTANVITYRSRSATREVGKVLGFDEALIDRLAKLMTASPSTAPRRCRATSARSVRAGRSRRPALVDLWQRMQDPQRLSASTAAAW